MAKSQRAHLVEQAKNKMRRAQVAHQHVEQKRQARADRDTLTANRVHHGTPQQQQRAMDAKAQTKSEIAFLKQSKENINKQHRRAEAAHPSGKTATGENVVLTAEQQARAAERKRTGRFQAGAHKGELTPAAIRGAARDRVKSEIQDARAKLAKSSRAPDKLTANRVPRPPRHGDVISGRPHFPRPGKPGSAGALAPPGPLRARRDRVITQGGPRPPRRATLLGNVAPRVPRRRKVRNSLY